MESRYSHTTRLTLTDIRTGDSVIVDTTAETVHQVGQRVSYFTLPDGVALEPDNYAIEYKYAVDRPDIAAQTMPVCVIAGDNGILLLRRVVSDSTGECALLGVMYSDVSKVSIVVAGSDSRLHIVPEFISAVDYAVSDSMILPAIDLYVVLHCIENLIAIEDADKEAVGNAYIRGLFAYACGPAQYEFLEACSYMFAVNSIDLEIRRLN